MDPLRLPCNILYLKKVATIFVNKWLSLGRYRSLTDSGHRVFSGIVFFMYAVIRINPVVNISILICRLLEKDMQN
jgi:hypothetical protein